MIMGCSLFDVFHFKSMSTWIIISCDGFSCLNTCLYNVNHCQKNFIISIYCLKVYCGSITNHFPFKINGGALCFLVLHMSFSLFIHNFTR